MPLLAHLEELRSRLIRCLIAVAIGFAVCYGVSAPLLRFFLAPIREALPERLRALEAAGLPTGKAAKKKKKHG